MMRLRPFIGRVLHARLYTKKVNLEQLPPASKLNIQGTLRASEQRVKDYGAAFERRTLELSILAQQDIVGALESYRDEHQRFNDRENHILMTEFVA